MATFIALTEIFPFVLPLYSRSENQERGKVHAWTPVSVWPQASPVLEWERDII